MDYNRIILYGIMVYTAINLVNGILYVSSARKEIIFTEKIDRNVSIVLGTIFYGVYIFIAGLIVYAVDNMIDSVLNSL